MGSGVELGLQDWDLQEISLRKQNLWKYTGIWRISLITLWRALSPYQRITSLIALSPYYKPYHLITYTSEMRKFNGVDVELGEVLIINMNLGLGVPVNKVTSERIFESSSYEIWCGVQSSRLESWGNVSLWGKFAEIWIAAVFFNLLLQKVLKTHFMIWCTTFRETPHNRYPTSAVTREKELGLGWKNKPLHKMHIFDDNGHFSDVGAPTNRRAVERTFKTVYTRRGPCQGCFIDFPGRYCSPGVRRPLPPLVTQPTPGAQTVCIKCYKLISKSKPPAPVKFRVRIYPGRLPSKHRFDCPLLLEDRAVKMCLRGTQWKSDGICANPTQRAVQTITQSIRKLFEEETVFWSGTSSKPTTCLMLSSNFIYRVQDLLPIQHIFWLRNSQTIQTFLSHWRYLNLNQKVSSESITYFFRTCTTSSAYGLNTTALCNISWNIQVTLPNPINMVTFH